MSESVNSSRRERLSSIPPFVIKATIAASLGGILFGYDMGVTSTALPQLKNTFTLSIDIEIDFTRVDLKRRVAGNHFC